MSLRQRRDHKPRPLIAFGGYNIPEDGKMDCLECGDLTEIVTVVGYDRTKPVSQRRTERSYVRHVRRWFKKP